MIKFCSDIHLITNTKIYDMKRPVLVVHGGAGGDIDYIRKHINEIKSGISEALRLGYNVLENNGSAVDAVERAVNELENNVHFNAGRGSAINAKAQVEMDAAIMNGENRSSGAVAIVQNVKNPVSLAKAIMLNTSYRFLGDFGAADYAKKINIPLEPDSYFITEHQYDAYVKKRAEEFDSGDKIAIEELNQKHHGTVGAVAFDKNGNLAAATSTGGTVNSKAGRIGDSCIIGAGCYADNTRCAISATGDGEYIIKNILANSITCAMVYKNMSIQEACDFILLEENKGCEGDMGVIAIDYKGKIGISFNCGHMIRAYKVEGKRPVVKIYI